MFLYTVRTLEERLCFQSCYKDNNAEIKESYLTWRIMLTDWKLTELVILHQ